MHRTLALVLALALALPASAETFTVGSKVLSEGDSVGRVYEVAGKPDRVVQLENGFGAGVGERWEYYRDGKAITLVIRGGRIVSISITSN